MTWSNGGTEAHYHHHFRALFETMAGEYERQNIILTDDLFANVGEGDIVDALYGDRKRRRMIRVCNSCGSPA
ncbi:hypothetical protein DEU56DRAFT_822475 [Suillus clintonianus]|uniref:uncharacterized protein n=1 Tax=Suillus clintonianus TaxID=1904413 RepID=UPI001B87D334|nr:uncharacterized protein DEU56DRAFT_822475 [Suillus clintonianus]KAG2126553.1 hypothetical protein DEU56DRAFT_822475 [Suillus clintonianus]